VSPEQAAALANALEHLRDSGSLTRELAERRTLTAHPEVLRELLAVAIDEAGESVGLACNKLLRGEASAGDVRARLTVLSELLALVDEVAKDAQRCSRHGFARNSRSRDEREAR
jgi:hypothetical protein